MSDRVPERLPAPKDGVQVVGDQRYRAIRGELMFPGARFEEPAVTQQAHQDYLAQAAEVAATKAATPSDPVQAQQLADLQTKNADLETRLAAAEAALAAIPKGTGAPSTGPTETTDGTGPAETGKPPKTATAS